jgi:hypothetical protein
VQSIERRLREMLYTQGKLRYKASRTSNDDLRGMKWSTTEIAVPELCVTKDSNFPTRH